MNRNPVVWLVSRLMDRRADRATSCCLTASCVFGGSLGSCPSGQVDYDLLDRRVVAAKSKRAI